MSAGSPRPTVHLVHHLARAGGTLISRCLGSMQNVVLLSEIHPLGTQVAPEFDPLFQASHWFKLLSGTEVQALRTRTATLAEIIALLAQKAASQDRQLVVRGWNHLDFMPRPLDFIGKSPQGAASGRLMLSEALSASCSIRQLATVRHPASQWLSWRRFEPTSDLTLEEFMAGCCRFATIAAQLGFVRYEDFTAQPVKVMQRMCEVLGIRFDPSFMQHWPYYRSVTGDLDNLKSHQIRHQGNLSLPRDLADALRSNSDYQETLRLLGYQ